MSFVFDESIKYSERQANLFLGLLSTDFLKKENIKQGDQFVWGDRLFLRDYRQCVQTFVSNNPNGGDFYVWLQDNVKWIKYE